MSVMTEDQFELIKRSWEEYLREFDGQVFLGYLSLGNATYLLIRSEFRDVLGIGEFTMDIIKYPTCLIPFRQTHKSEWENLVKSRGTFHFDNRFVSTFDFPEEEFFRMVDLFEKITEDGKFKQEQKEAFYFSYKHHLTKKGLMASFSKKKENLKNVKNQIKNLKFEMKEGNEDNLLKQSP